MNVQGCMRMPFAAVTVLLVVHAFVPGCQAGGDKRETPPAQQQRLAAIRAEGTGASLTVFPVVVGDSAMKDAGDVLALLLEQEGMTKLETTDAAFRPPAEATFEEGAALFGAFVREHPIETDYALYAAFVGGPKTGVQEIRGVIVDKAGQGVWLDRQTAADQAFQRAKPDCPMDCCVFLAERVRAELNIPKSARDESGEGRIARRLAKSAPGPDKAEFAAMEKRQAAMKQAGRSVTVAVFPVRLSDDEVGREDATHLAALLNEKKLCAAKAVDSPLRVHLEPARNEQKTLWDLARAFQDYVKQNPPEADYALLADYIMHPRGDRAWAVHFVICDRQGEWVIVDFQNDHWEDFQSIDPKTHDDCGRLVARRLEGYLR